MVLTYVLAMLIAYLGLITGVILGMNSPEEMKPGKQWLTLLSSFLFGLFVGVIIAYFVIFPVTYIHYGLAILAVMLVLARFVRAPRFVLYTLLAMTIALFIGHQSFFLVLAALLFLYGLPEGSLIVEPYTEKKCLLRPWKTYLIDAWRQSWGYPFFVLIITIFFMFM